MGPVLCSRGEAFLAFVDLYKSEHSGNWLIAARFDGCPSISAAVVQKVC